MSQLNYESQLNHVVDVYIDQARTITIIDQIWLENHSWYYIPSAWNNALVQKEFSFWKLLATQHSDTEMVKPNHTAFNKGTNILDLTDIANMFCERYDKMWPVFGVFCKEDLKLP